MTIFLRRSNIDPTYVESTIYPEQETKLFARAHAKRQAARRTSARNPPPPPRRQNPQRINKGRDGSTIYRTQMLLCSLSIAQRSIAQHSAGYLHAECWPQLMSWHRSTLGTWHPHTVEGSRSAGRNCPPASFSFRLAQGFGSTKSATTWEARTALGDKARRYGAGGKGKGERASGVENVMDVNSVIRAAGTTRSVVPRRSATRWFHKEG